MLIVCTCMHILNFRLHTSGVKVIEKNNFKGANFTLASNFNHKQTRFKVKKPLVKKLLTIKVSRTVESGR